MTMMRRLSLPLVALLLLPSSCFSFTTVTTTTTTTSTTTHLNLVPSQGKELEAFVNSNRIQILQENKKGHHIEIDSKNKIQQKKDNDNDDAHDASPSPGVITPLTAARSFISRIFHQNDEVLVYPIVGFRWVGNKVVPTTSSAACVIHREEEREELFGWFAAPPPLDHDDDDKEEEVED
mmetsp:Transcript_14923/g.20322  ORF Transcript_14923/g.20322 Transcript_14923/m.20322 type:complete len:179 (-) Transcript_14923:366-902(-)|eukprot:CAMPEP_0185730258 /NCGR_PEP_ID=MMETSP1171-20130828/9121_1 /TAXON_ID=374046 /ORGANISM="Helicotheca tamensis, Strain CCMP826" /LENGTH=178 /DNA_ID=CAMNT_0028399271 /DNA_START=158 /DNA_END=694 /DNA_ORIENTATION=-